MKLERKGVENAGLGRATGRAQRAWRLPAGTRYVSTGVDCAHDVYRQAGSPTHVTTIDMAELYVPFSWYEPMWLEAMTSPGPVRGGGWWRAG